VFARSFAKLYGVSERKGVTAFWVSLLPASVQEQWGDQEISDADIIKMAHERSLYGTTPWLEKMHDSKAGQQSLTHQRAASRPFFVARDICS
jgi:hypothetical protein